MTDCINCGVRIITVSSILGSEWLHQPLNLQLTTYKHCKLLLAEPPSLIQFLRNTKEETT